MPHHKGSDLPRYTQTEVHHELEAAANDITVCVCVCQEQMS